MKNKENLKRVISLIVLIITFLFSYDYGKKCRNSNKFLIVINYLNV